MRHANKPDDAVLSNDGTAKVNRKNVGFWERRCLIEDDRPKHYYFFFLSKGSAPVLMEYFCHEFRAAIPVYLSRRNDPSFVSAASYELIVSRYAASTPGATWAPRPESVESEDEIAKYEVQRKERKAKGASYGHVKRRIRANEPLTGKTLELALELVTPVKPGAPVDELNQSIAKKLKAGEPLSDYESHIMCDVYLLHARLA